MVLLDKNNTLPILSQNPSDSAPSQFRSSRPTGPPPIIQNHYRHVQNRLTVNTTVRRDRSKSPAVRGTGEQTKNGEEIDGTLGRSGQKRRRPESVNRLIYVDTSRARSNGPIVRMCLEILGWKECPNGRENSRPCDIYWHAFVHPDMKEIVRSGKVNKFPGMADLAKKISLTRALTSMQKLFPDQYDFYPRSWFIPAQLHEFYEDYYSISSMYKTEEERRGLWFIAKPDDGAQGEKIYLIQNPSELQNLDQPQLVQQYVSEPYLMQDKLKFDLRIYCVIRSLNPLTVYIAREGLARFCTQQYRTPSAGNANRTYMHLTNYSLNKQNQDGFVHANNTAEQGSKRLLSSVFHQMEARGVDTRKIWHDIKMIVVKTVLALVPELLIRYENQYYGALGPQCFQILGFDIILDKDLRPILLEINACPSLSVSPPDDHETAGGVSVVDEAIKLPLVKDTLLLVSNQLPDQRQHYHNNKGSDDSALAVMGQRSCLSEIFPAQFGYACSPLLVLNRAAYFFMQFVNIRKTVEMTLSGCRNFVKKCGLIDVMSIEELDSLYSQLASEWVDQYTQGLPFYGFVELLMVLASRKYSKSNCLFDAFRSVLHHCQYQIRYHGVRSSRLRVDAVEDRNHQLKDFYLLPHHRKATGPAGSANGKRRSASSVSLPKI